MEWYGFTSCHFLSSPTMSRTNIQRAIYSSSERVRNALYVYHAEKIKEQYEKLISAFSVIDTRFFYACKALTNIHILRYVHSLGCGVDCSSINEVKLALHAGFPKGQNIIYFQWNCF